MTNLFVKLTTRKSMLRTASLARQIARRSQGDVFGRVHDLIFGMSPHEMRGYIRARAARVIRRELSSSTVAVGQLSDANRQLLFRITTECVVQLVMGEVEASATPKVRTAA